MIKAIGTVWLAADDLDAARTSYQALLGVESSAHAAGGNVEHLCFGLANVTLDIVPRDLTDRGGDRAPQAADVQGLGGIAFAVDDIDEARRRLARRGLETTWPAPVGPDDGAGVLVAPSRLPHHVRLSFHSAQAPATAAPPRDPSAIAGLDHVVVRSPNPERAIVLYAGRLDLELKLDVTRPEWGVRLLFFRCGDLIVEIAHDLNAGLSEGPDKLWGLSWRSADIEATHRRLAGAGFDLSPVRPGRKPGTRVFTVRNRTAGVPTLVVGPQSNA